MSELALVPWWRRGVIYQVYPWSFQDSNGDGIGDLVGIRGRLEYLAWLGVDAIWISPIYPSPMADFGYDVSDYCDVDPRFGTLADFDALLARAHELGLKVILDYVPNHTSDQHPWFMASRSSRTDPKRDYYIWHEPAADGGPPTNWLSEFGGSAWEWDETTRQYYYHAYLKQQPDLNFRNPDVQRELFRVLEFWLARGVDGFRIDTIHHLIKDDQFRDNPPNPDFKAGMPPHRRLIRTFTTDRPEVQAAIAAMRKVVEGYPDRVLIGEAYLPVERLMAYYGVDLAGLHLPFNFQLIHAQWEAATIAAIARSYEAALPAGAWPNWVLGNHDRSRIASRVGTRQARVAAMLLLTLRGTPTLYYGDELGLRDGVILPHQVRDPWEKNVPGLGLGRDPERTPMQWSSGRNAGFSSGTPWLPIGEDYLEQNVESERDDPRSMLSLYRNLLALRRREPALSLGSYQELFSLTSGVLAYQRSYDGRTLTVVLNLTDEAKSFALPEAPSSSPAPGRSDISRLLLSTDPDRDRGSFSGEVSLRPDEGWILAPG
jgi:alpha-glucosidase